MGGGRRGKKKGEEKGGRGKGREGEGKEKKGGGGSNAKERTVGKKRGFLIQLLRIREQTFVINVGRSWREKAPEELRNYSRISFLDRVIGVKCICKKNEK